MTIILVFDTETTGLAPYENLLKIKEINKKKYNEINNSLNNNSSSWDEWMIDWPVILQLSYILYDTNKNTCKLYNKYIDFSLDKLKEYMKIENTHETTKIALQASIKEPNFNKISIGNALDNFMKDFQSADIIVGHHVLADQRMILAELQREGRDKDFDLILKSKKFYCTQKNSINIVKKLNVNGKKFSYPSLAETYEKLFHYKPLSGKLHNAMNDVIITFRCFYKLYFKKDVCGKNDEIDLLINSISPSNHHCNRKSRKRRKREKKTKKIFKNKNLKKTKKYK